MKVQHDTGWNSLINKALSKKPVDKLEETNSELSKYSSISSLSNIWSAKDLWKRKNRQNLPKRHRFPPSLLTSRAADFWNTLMPLRTNCSCSSVSVDENCSRLSFGVSVSDATFGSNSNSSVPPRKKTVLRKTLGDTLEHTHLAFELLIARMVRLLKILNRKSGSSPSQVFSSSNLKILPPPDSKSRKNEEMTVTSSYTKSSSITSRSSDAKNQYRDLWSAGRTGKKWESSSKFEIPEQKRRGRGFFPPPLLGSKTLRAPKNVLTEEELVYLLQYKKSLVSEYFFQRKLDSTDLKKTLITSEQKTFIYGTQSDSRLQEDDLHQFVQFIRARKKKDHSLNTQESNSNFPSLNNENNHNFSTSKRRVTFSDPLAESSASLLNRCSSKTEDGILSAKIFMTTITNNIIAKNIQSDDSPSDSSVSLKACFANLSLKSRSSKVDDLDPYWKKSTTEEEACTKNITEERLSSAQLKYTEDMSEIEFGRKADVKKSQSDENENFFNRSSSTALPSSLQKLNKIGSKILVKKTLDCGTTHVPTLDDVGSTMILEIDNTGPRVTFKESSPQENFEKCLKRKICPMEICGKRNSVDDDDCTASSELEDESIRSKITRFSNIEQSRIPDQEKSARSFSKEREFGDSDLIDHPSSPPGKSVTFEDCCQTISDQSIISDKKRLKPLLRSKDKLVSSSESKGRFELSWKGCWKQQVRTNLVQNIKQPKAEHTEDEIKFLESNLEGIASENVEPNLFSKIHELSATISSSQTSYCTTMEDETQLANNFASKDRNKNPRTNSPSSYPHPSNNPSFMAVAECLERDEPIPWMINSKESFLKPCKPTSKLNYDLESNTEAIRLRNRTELRRGLSNVYKGIINPEIWRSEVRSEPAASSKLDWYTRQDSDKYSWKSSKIRNDWLFRKLQELQSSPERDCDSDYYAESEMESDFECERDLSMIKRSFSNLDTHSKNCRKFKMRRNRFGRNLFLNKVWSGKKIIFNECRCHKNTPSNGFDLRSTECDRRTVFQESDQRSNQNFFSHLRARIILDSETDDSDFTSSIQTDFSYDFKRRNEHINKMKCRRFVKSLRSISSEDDRQSSSTRLLQVAFGKSFHQASVQSAFSKRNIGTNVSANQNFYNMMDVCIDTYDLCPHKPIEMTNKKASDLLFSNKNSSCQTVESAFGNLSSFQSTQGVPQVSSILVERDKPLEQPLQIHRSNDQRMSTALANLSIQINNASDNLAKLRSSEIRTEPGRVVHFPATEEDNFTTASSIESTFPIPSRCLPPVKTLENVQSSKSEKSSNVLNNPNSYTVEESNCPICDAVKKPTARYLLPACRVKGIGPDSKSNEKDPWNRVMEQAKAQSHYKGRNPSTCLEKKPSLKRSRVAPSAYDPVNLESFERNQNSFADDQSDKEEVRIQLVKVKDNSSQAATVYDLEFPAVMNKISTPQRKARSIRLPCASAALGASSTSSDFPILSLPRTRSPRRNMNKKPQAVPNRSNRLLYIISETAELTHQMSIKSPAANFFT